MKVQLLSDLHLESQPDFRAHKAPEADVLVLAGDIGSYQAGSCLSGNDFGLEQFSPLKRADAWQKVLFLPGNHEFDAIEYDEAYQRLRDTCERLGITWLERETLTFGGVRFLGTTLWSDFDAVAHVETEPAKRQKIRGKAFRAANFYLQKNTTLRHGEPMLAEALRELALECQQWLRSELLKPFEGTTVVVTHFAPSLRSADPRYGITSGTAGFCNSLESLLPHADVWMHGHLHCSNDYVVTGTLDGRDWQCRVVANPLGYARKGEQKDFVAQFCLDLGE